MLLTMIENKQEVRKLVPYDLFVIQKYQKLVYPETCSGNEKVLIVFSDKCQTHLTTKINN